MTKFAIFLVGILAMGAGCGGSSSSKQASNQLNDTCVIPSSWGSQDVSAACVEATDCKGKCCSCTGSGKSWAGAACVDGKCAGESVTCALTATTEYCD